MTIDKHGLKMTGLRHAAGATKELTPYAPWHIQLGYDKATGKVICSEVYGGGNYLEYRDPSIIAIASITKPMTMQEIADAIHDRLARLA